MKKELIILLGLLAAACATKAPEDFKEDKSLYDYAEKLYRDREYEDAIKFYDSLRNRFPQSPLATPAELRVADAYYEKQEFATAETSYQTFLTLHPTHSNFPFVMFQIAMTHFKRMPKGPDRDQTQTEKAVESFQEFLSRFPNDKNVSEARANLDKAKRLLIGREMYIANYYLKQKEYRAALLRLQTVRGNVDFPEMRLEASYKLGLAYAKLKEPDDARKYLAEAAEDPRAGKYQFKAKELLARLGK